MGFKLLAETKIIYSLVPSLCPISSQTASTRLPIPFQLNHGHTRTSPNHLDSSFVLPPYLALSSPKKSPLLLLPSQLLLPHLLKSLRPLLPLPLPLLPRDDLSPHLPVGILTNLLPRKYRKSWLSGPRVVWLCCAARYGLRR
jgi:hypothetical protein